MSRSENNQSNSSLFIRSAASLINAEAKNAAPLSEIVNQSLIHIQTCKIYNKSHKIGAHEIFGPDYQLVCAWAEDLKLTAEEVLERLLTSSPDIDDSGYFTWRETTALENGRFKVLFVDRMNLPISFFPTIEGLSIENLKIQESVGVIIEEILTPVGAESQTKKKNNQRILELDLSMVASLKVLDCSHLGLKKLNLGNNSNITRLFCQYNDLENLNLENSPSLQVLDCSSNDFSNIDLSRIPKLDLLMCSGNNLTNFSLVNNLDLIGLVCNSNQLTDLCLEPVSNLRILDCSDNKIQFLDLTLVPKVTHLDCSNNPIAEIDLRPLGDIIELLQVSPNTRIVQRPNQNFR